jgi:hypothetical protein
VRFVGIDPGASGAIGVLDEHGALVCVHDLPVFDGRLDVRNLRALLPDGRLLFVVEDPNAMPRQGVSSSFKFGRTVGECQAFAKLTGDEMTLVSPAKWKRDMRLSADKEQVLRRARELYPDAPISLKRHHDRAEALLLARWLWQSRP